MDPGKVLGKRQLEHLVHAVTDIAAFYATHAPAPASASSTLLVLSADGKGIVLVRGRLRLEATRCGLWLLAYTRDCALASLSAVGCEAS